MAYFVRKGEEGESEGEGEGWKLFTWEDQIRRNDGTRATSSRQTMNSNNSFGVSFQIIVHMQ